MPWEQRQWKPWEVTAEIIKPFQRTETASAFDPEEQQQLGNLMKFWQWHGTKKGIDWKHILKPRETAVRLCLFRKYIVIFLDFQYKNMKT